MGDPSSISGSPLRNSAARWGATSLRSSADLPRTYSPKTDIPKILTNSFEDVPKGRKLSSLVHAAKK